MQLQRVNQLKNRDFMVNHGYDPSEGPSNPNSRTIEVPKECFDMIMGKGGDTLKGIQYNSGAKKVELASNVQPNSNFINVYVDGSYEAYLQVNLIGH